MMTVNLRMQVLALSKGLRLARVITCHRFGVMPKVTIIAGSNPAVSTKVRVAQVSSFIWHLCNSS